MLCALIVCLALLAFVTWGWATERGIRIGLVKALDIEREAYRQLIHVRFNEGSVGSTFKVPTVRFAEEHIREQAKHPTTRFPVPSIPPGKRTPRH